MPCNRITRLYLVRHGETDFNREQRLQGALDVPLNDTGAAQARRLADRFAALSIACVVASPLVRASATAALIADACRCPLRIDSRLREVDHGSWSGLTIPEIGRRFPALVSSAQLTSAAYDISGGERLLDVQERVAEVLGEILDRHDNEAVAIVGHGVALGLMCCAVSGTALGRFHEHLPPNAGVVVLTFLDGRFVEARPMAAAVGATRVKVSR